MKLGIISDTHKKVGRAKKVIDLLVEKNVNAIIHAGDIVKIETIELIKQTNLPYRAVFGNNDFDLLSLQNEFHIMKEPHYFKVGNVTIKLMHHPFYFSPDTDIIIYGHTHIADIKYINQVLFLNPGEVCARNKPISEFMILDIKEDKYIIDYYQRELKQNEWKIEKKEFLRNSIL